MIIMHQNILLQVNLDTQVQSEALFEVINVLMYIDGLDINDILMQSNHLAILNSLYTKRKRNKSMIE